MGGIQSNGTACFIGKFQVVDGEIESEKDGG